MGAYLGGVTRVGGKEGSEGPSRCWPLALRACPDAAPAAAPPRRSPMRVRPLWSSGPGEAWPALVLCAAFCARPVALRRRGLTCPPDSSIGSSTRTTPGCLICRVARLGARAAAQGGHPRQRRVRGAARGPRPSAARPPPTPAARPSPRPAPPSMPLLLCSRAATRAIGTSAPRTRSICAHARRCCSKKTSNARAWPARLAASMSVFLSSVQTHTSGNTAPGGAGGRAGRRKRLVQGPRESTHVGARRGEARRPSHSFERSAARRGAGGGRAAAAAPRRPRRPARPARAVLPAAAPGFLLTAAKTRHVPRGPALATWPARR
jgi:hypothetical protein